MEKLFDCPRCEKPMKKIKKEKVIIDVCPSCRGMWLDDGEIDKLAAWGREHGEKEEE